MAMVDRGAMTPNEWRAVVNMAPVQGGDEPIRRLDTQVVNAVEKLTNMINKDNFTVVAESIKKILSGVGKPRGGEKDCESRDQRDDYPE